MEKKKIIIDTDIGDDIDDAFALQYAINCPDLELLGVTVTYKNVLQRAQMAMKLLALNGRTDIGVYMGYDNPYRETPKPFLCEHTREDGVIDLLAYRKDLDDYVPEREHAADFIIERAEKFPGEITLFGLGPLTTIARAIEKAPDAMRKLRQIILMCGNREQALEYNIMIDPEAAKIVFDSDIPKVYVGGNVTLKTWFTQRYLHRELAFEAPALRYINEMMMEWISFNMRPPVMHDALTVSVIHRNYVTFAPMKADVQLGEGMRGKIVATPCEDGHPASVSVDRDGFMEYFFSVMERSEKPDLLADPTRGTVKPVL